MTNDHLDPFSSLIYLSKNIVIFHSYVSFPEGIWNYGTMELCIICVICIYIYIYICVCVIISMGYINRGNSIQGIWWVLTNSNGILYIVFDIFLAYIYIYYTQVRHLYYIYNIIYIYPWTSRLYNICIYTYTVYIYIYPWTSRLYNICIYTYTVYIYILIQRRLW